MIERVRLPAPHVVAAALCVGLVAALGVAAPSPVAVVAVAALGVSLAARSGARRTLLVALGVAAVGWWWGTLRVAELETSMLAREIGRAGLARLEVTGPSRRSDFVLRVPVEVVRFRGFDVREPSRLELPPDRAPPQGSVLEVVASVRAPRRAEAAGEFDERTYLGREGIHAVLRASSYRVVGRRGGIGGVADRIRRWLSTSMAPGVRGERRALIAGVVLGEDEGLQASLRDDFRASGLYHLLAVSGQNVAYVVGGALLLAWVLGVPRWAGHLAAVAAVVAYVLAVGWQPSVVRAGVAGVLASLAWLASRPGDRWYFLLVGAAVLLAVNPYNALAPGFQLSFAAVAAIFVVVPRIERRLAGYPLPARLGGVVAVAAGCGAATAPILWLHFGAVPIFSIVANALAAPAVPPLLGMALVAAALEPFVPSAAFALAWLNGWLAAYLAWCARAIGDLPHAQLTSGRSLALVAGGSVVVAVAVAIRPPRAPRLVGLAGMLVALLAAWQLWWGHGNAPAVPTGLRVTFLDVGQGDAILVQVPDGAVLVDQGPPEARVADQLESLGVDEVAAVVLTHPQRDHIGGARDVLASIDVDLALDPRIPVESTDEDAALAEARRRGVPVITARSGRVFRLGKLRIEILWPEAAAPPEADPNDHAIVLLASYGAVDMLLTADAEGEVTTRLRPPPVEILKVAHHGSDDPFLDELLALVRPRVAVISVGRGNDYGHPDPDTLAVLEGVPGLALYRTDEDGEVVIESNGSSLAVAAER